MAKVMNDLGVHNVGVDLMKAEKEIEHIKRQIHNCLNARPEDIWIEALLKDVLNLAKEQAKYIELKEVQSYLEDDVEERQRTVI